MNFTNYNDYNYSDEIIFFCKIKILYSLTLNIAIWDLFYHILIIDEYLKGVYKWSKNRLMLFKLFQKNIKIKAPKKLDTFYFYNLVYF